MKFKASLKYNLSGFLKSVKIFYLVIYIIWIWMTVWSLTARKGSGYSNMGGMEVSSMIFLFVCGLNSFKSQFKMMMANGVSRQTMFKSHVTAILPAVGIMALVDSINNLIFGLVINYTGFFQQIYNRNLPKVLAAAEGFIWMFCIYLAVWMLGFLITTLYYRMNRPLKLTISIGVPVLLFVILPYLDSNICNHQIFKGISWLINKSLGLLDGHNPYIAMISGLLGSCVLGVCSFLTMRTVGIKE